MRDGGGTGLTSKCLPSRILCGLELKCGGCVGEGKTSWGDAVLSIEGPGMDGWTLEGEGLEWTGEEEKGETVLDQEEWEWSPLW